MHEIVSYSTFPFLNEATRESVQGKEDRRSKNRTEETKLRKALEIGMEEENYSLRDLERGLSILSLSRTLGRRSDISVPLNPNAVTQKSYKIDASMSRCCNTTGEGRENVTKFRPRRQ